MKGKFYNFPTSQGMKMVNVNNIASIEDLNPNIRVTLNVKNDKGDFISFVAHLPWDQTTGDILF